MPVPVELGAEFVHGMHPAMAGLRLPLLEVAGQPWCFDGGRLRPCEDAPATRVMDRLRDEREDRTFAGFLADCACPEQEKAWALAYVEGFNAAYAERIGVAGLAHQERASAAIGGESAWRVDGGYDRVLRNSGVQPLLNTPVREICWRPGRVEAAGFCAPRAIVTVPLPVLQEIRFDPPPAEILHAAGRMAMGKAVRATFEFDRRFWDPAMGFLFSTDRVMPTWWTTYPVESSLLVGWSAAHAADRLLRGDMVEGAMAALQRLFGKDVRGLLKRVWRHDWTADPFARGAYSYIPAGAFDAPAILSEPVQSTLFFAGEHTCTEGHIGTVHGAMLTGLRAARQVLAAE